MNKQSVVVDSNSTKPTSLSSLSSSLWRHRQLIIKMTKRDVVGRYKGSLIGLAWSFFTPVIMLIVYTFVFSIIFNARWGTDVEVNKTQFALVLFVGLIVLHLFSDVMNRAPDLIISNVNYVKKVIFPLEILPIISVGAGFFQALVSLTVLLIAFLIFNGYLNWTVFYIPIIFTPIIILAIGFSWILASLGVFIRDIGQTVGLITTLMMFLSPIFYPISAVPLKFQKFIMANPLTFIIEQTRGVIIYGQVPNWNGLLIYFLTASCIMWIGYIWFQKTRKGFADVL